jgi:hypothetical protein
MVPQIFNLPYRRIVFGQALDWHRRPGIFSTPCGLQIRDTAECNSALHALCRRFLICRIAELYSGRRLIGIGGPGFFPHLADYKSAIQQDAILRYTTIYVPD